MPLTNKGTEILANMRKQYGDKKGEQVFYAMINAGKLTGVHDSEEDLRLGKILEGVDHLEKRMEDRSEFAR